MSTSYTNFVHPQLGYLLNMWDPHTQVTIQKLKNVQQRTERFVTGNYNSTDSVEDERAWGFVDNVP